MERILHAPQYKAKAPTELPRSMPCPCCGTQTKTPSIEIIIDNRDVTPKQAKVLRAIWNAKGHPVSRARLYDAMYCDDIDGGPGHEKMRQSLKLAVFHLREKLKGTGIDIETVKARLGYRLKITE